MSQQRSVNLDLLRNMAMLFIVIYHFFIHGVMHQHTTPGKGFFITIDSSFTEMINFLLSQMVMVVVSTGVNLFVMISGYLLIQKQEFRAKSLIRLWIKVLLYALTIAIICYFFGEVGISAILKSFLPLTTNQYWFMLPYFGLMLIAPFIARLVCNLTQKQYESLLVALFAINFYLPYGRILSGGGQLLWFVFLFCAAGYLRLFPIKIKHQKSILLLSVVVVTFFFVMYSILKAFINDSIIDSSDTFYLKEPMYNGLCFFVSILIFNVFLNIRCSLTKSAHLISVISASTLGVYLLHDNRLVRDLIWERSYDFSVFPSSFNFWLIMLVTCFSIFTIAIVIDIIVEQVLKTIRPEVFVFEKVYKSIKNRIDEFKI